MTESLNVNLHQFKLKFEKSILDVDKKLEKSKILKDEIYREKKSNYEEFQNILRDHEEQLILLKSGQERLKAPLTDYVDLLTTEMNNITEQYEVVSTQNLDLQRANSRLMTTN